MPTTRARPGPWRLLVFGFFTSVAGFGTMILTRQPSNTRPWAADHARMPQVSFSDSSVRIADVRNFRYSGPDSFDIHYEDRTYDLRQLDAVWLVLTPFSKAWRGAAHSFATFGFSDSTYLSVSIEARRGAGEAYGLLRGLGRNFELIYVIGDERDVIGKRAAFGEFDVYLFPIHTTPDRVRSVFLDLLHRAERLRTHPEFYNTLNNNCTSNLVASVNRVAPGRIPTGIRQIFPGYADEVARNIGLIDSTLSIEDARAQYRINDRARAALASPDFSHRIRSPRGLP